VLLENRLGGHATLRGYVNAKVGALHRLLLLHQPRREAIIARFAALANRFQATSRELVMPIANHALLENRHGGHATSKVCADVELIDSEDSPFYRVCSFQRYC
jgi:hypothetical protein